MIPTQSSMQRKFARGNIVYSGGSNAPNNQRGTNKSKQYLQDAVKRRAQEKLQAKKV